MNAFSFAACAAIATVIACATARAGEVSPLTADQPSTMNGIDIACTGVGDEAQTDPRWPAYGVRIEFADGQAQYLSDVTISIADASGTTLLETRCDSPWFLAKLSPGKYTVSGTFEGRLTKTATFTAPKSGQSRIVVRFPEVVDR
ncbi:MAG: hypothetical protein K8S25_16535 [Alphaproteobacteria bacterium]|nr:hypothetical protein [Alphaproteobacteria bacterium]